MIYVQCIHKVYPDLSVKKVSFNEGQNNNIIVINEEIIFRFPKYDHTVRQLEIETAILNGIQDYITLNIPNPIYKSLETRTVGQVFVGYLMLPGELLLRDTLMAIEDEEKLQNLATQLAIFLKELHSVSVEETIAFDLPSYDNYLEWTDMYARIHEKVFPHMRPDARNWATNHFETFLNDPSNFEFKPVLVHGDFGPGNILFDPKTQNISGIIDFGSAGLGDPAVDFAAIFCQAGYGESFLRRFYKVYPEIEFVLARARFYAGTFALQEALFGIENNDIEAFKSGIASYL